MAAPVVPAPSVVTVTVSYCPASTTALPVVPTKSVTYLPSVSASPSKPANGTSVTTPSPSKFTGAASTMSSSIGAIAFAGLIAAFFA
jgi:hypothetical protein